VNENGPILNAEAGCILSRLWLWNHMFWV